MTFSRLPYNFEEALAEVKSWRSSHIPAGDIRALKHRIHELEGEVIGYKRILQEADTAAQRKPLTHIQAKELVAKYGNDLLKLVFQTEAAHGIKEQP